MNSTKLLNLYHLLEQRMAKQNDSSLIHFVITVYYDDGQSVVHNNTKDFESFHPTTPCHPTAVTISAIYLIKFRGHDTPEKQEIEIAFATHPDYRDAPRRFFGSVPIFEYRIVHTERTWATDIAGLLKNHAATVLSTPGSMEKFFRRHSDDFAIYFSQLVFLVSIFLWANFAQRIVEATTLDAENLRLAAMFFVKSVPAFAMLGVMIVAVKTYVENTAFFFRRSFILFTQHDSEDYARGKKSQMWGVVRYAAVWTVTLMTGVLSNILYSKNWLW